MDTPVTTLSNLAGMECLENTAPPASNQKHLFLFVCPRLTDTDDHRVVCLFCLETGTETQNATSEICEVRYAQIIGLSIAVAKLRLPLVARRPVPTCHSRRYPKWIRSPIELIPQATASAKKREEKKQNIMSECSFQHGHQRCCILARHGTGLLQSSIKAFMAFMRYP